MSVTDAVGRSAARRSQAVAVTVWDACSRRLMRAGADEVAAVGAGQAQRQQGGGHGRHEVL